MQIVIARNAECGCGVGAALRHRAPTPSRSLDGRLGFDAARARPVRWRVMVAFLFARRARVAPALALARTPVTTDADGTRRFGPAWVREVHGIRVLHVTGDRYTMAYQHGRLLAEEIADGSLYRASRIATDAIEGSVGKGALGAAVKWYASQRIARRMMKTGVRHARRIRPDQEPLAEAHGLSAATGIDVDTIVRAALGPETAQVLLGRFSSLAVGSAPSQCTSFAAWGDATADGELLIGRNTDYPLNGFFDRYPTVVYQTPTDGGHRFMTVTSAGFHNGGVCGFNEHGLYLAIHTVPTQRVSSTRLPVFLVGQHVLRTARTFAEAEAILVDSKPAAGWSYHVVSTRERRTATFELCADRVERLDATGSSHVTTNHWRTPAMAPHNLAVNASVDEDTRARMMRAEALIAEANGALDARGAMRILGDKIDPYSGDKRVAPNTIAVSITVSSSVWAPAQQRVHVANGRAPVSLNAYVALPTIDAFAPDAFDAASCTTTDPGSTGTPGEQAFIAGKIALDYEDDAEAAVAHLLEARAVDDDPSIALVLGLAALRCDRRELAVEALEAAANQRRDLRRRAIASYVLGRCYADRGAHDEARACFDAVTSDADAGDKLVAAAARAKRRHRRLGPRDISPMAFLADAYRYEGPFG